jgi:hypothetical protein
MILLVTDFREFYRAQIKGAIWQRIPETRILDLTVPRHDILSGAFIIDSVVDYFPDAVIIGVVDPGVGGSRRNILIKTAKNYFVGPDNGLFSLACKRYPPLEMWEIEKKSLSHTFHGRDIYAPTAAHLLLGEEVDGKVIESIEQLTIKEPIVEKNTVTCTVLYVDAFGNSITNLPEKAVPPMKTASFMSREIPVLHTYTEAEGCVMLIGSHGYLEIAWNRGNAAQLFGIEPGDTITFSYTAMR